MPGLRVLTALDTARTQFYHFKAIIIAGMGLFTDAYDLFCIPPILKLLGPIYYKGTEETDGELAIPGVIPAPELSAIIAIALLGTVVGQLVFGWLGDRMGRRRVYGLALVLMVFSSLGSGFSICKTKKCVLSSLCFFRFWLGVGIGGDYPLSAVIMAEFANKKTRGSFIAAVFSMQGFGILVSSAVTMAVCKVFDAASRAKTPSKLAPPDEADLAWRLILMFGAIPAAFTYYWRMMMPETARYTALVERNISQAVRDMERVLDVPLDEITDEWDAAPDQPSYGLVSKQFAHQHGRDLFSCSATWFIVDVIFYTSNLFQSLVYRAQFYPKPDAPKTSKKYKNMLNPYEAAFQVASLQAIIAICSTIPGYWACVLLIDRVGRVKIQMMGFLVMSFCLFMIGGPYFNHWYHNPNAVFYILYGLTFFFSNLGPNTTTFMVPAELFPARLRTTCHGISGAAGKMGAIVGSVGFLWASQDKEKSKIEEPGYRPGIGMRKSLLILGGVAAAGAVLTYFLSPAETKGKSLEENETPADPQEVQLMRSSSNATRGEAHAAIP